MKDVLPLPAENPARRTGFRRLLGPLGVGALTTLFFVALWWRDPLLCWNDDYQISILPVLADVARSWNEGHWPLLSPYCWACGNLAGEYQYGTFSVFVNALVILVFKGNWSYPTIAMALSAGHLFVMGAGGFMLARGRAFSTSLATMVGLITALNGWMVCWGATDWFGALAALAWLPWAWWAFEESLAAPTGWRRWLLPTPFVYLLLTGGFPYTVIMLVAVTGWLAVHAWVKERRLLAVAPLAVGWLFGLGLAAPAWLSLLEYMHGSARARGDDLHHDAWVVPWRSLPGFIASSWGAVWPDFSGRPLARPALEFTGSLVPLAAIVAAGFARWRCRARSVIFNSALRWSLCLAAFALALCMLPTAGVFRWSFRWLPLFHITLALAGAEAFRWWRTTQRSEDADDGRRWWQHPAASAVALTGVVAVLAPVLSTPLNAQIRDQRHPAAVPFVLFLLALAWLAAAVFLPVAGRARKFVVVLVTLGSLAIPYWLLPTNPQVPRYPFEGNLDKVAPLAADRLYLAFTDAAFIKYHGDHVPAGFGAVLRLGSTGMFAGVHLINGYSPIRAAGVAQTFNLETHGQIEYPYLANFLTPEMTGEDGLLARLGVDGLIIASDLPFDQGPGASQEWTAVFHNAEGTIYHRRGGPKLDVTAWTTREPGAAPDLGLATIAVLENSRQRVMAQISASDGSNKPVLLAFRRPYFPGYRATFNGLDVPVHAYQGLLPTVELPAGEAGGLLVLSYRPLAIKLGGTVAGLTLLAIGSVAWTIRRQRRAAA